MALDFDLWVRTMGLLTAGGGMALHLSSGGALGLLILGKEHRRKLNAGEVHPVQAGRELPASTSGSLALDIWICATLQFTNHLH